MRSQVLGQALVGRVRLGREDQVGQLVLQPTAGQDGAEKQEDEPGSRPAVERSRESGEPLARGAERMRGCHDWHRPGRSAGMLTAIVLVGPAFVCSRTRTTKRGRKPAAYVDSSHEWATGCLLTSRHHPDN